MAVSCEQGVNEPLYSVQGARFLVVISIIRTYLATHFHLLLTLRMCGVIHFLPLHAFMLWTRSALYGAVGELQVCRYCVFFCNSSL